MTEQVCVWRVGATDLLDGCDKSGKTSTIVSGCRVIHEGIVVCRIRFTLFSGDKHMAWVDGHE